MTYQATLELTVFKTTVKVFFTASAVTDCVPHCESWDLDGQAQTIRDWVNAKLTAEHFKAQPQPLSQLVALLKAMPGATSVEISERHPEDRDLVRGYRVDF